MGKKYFKKMKIVHIIFIPFSYSKKTIFIRFNKLRHLLGFYD